VKERRREGGAERLLMTLKEGKGESCVLDKTLLFPVIITSNFLHFNSLPFSPILFYFLHLFPSIFFFRALESEKENFNREKVNLLHYVQEIEKNIEAERQQEKAEMREKGELLPFFFYCFPSIFVLFCC
jgi:hypothetical protein